MTPGTYASCLVVPYLSYRSLLQGSFLSEVLPDHTQSPLTFL